MNNIHASPLVTIGIPVYNGENFLYQALNSLVSQSFTNFQILISDNASTDSTDKICKHFCDKYNFIHYYRQPFNIGLMENFNYLKVKGRASKYFMWAAHDDLWDNNWLAVLVKNIKDNDLCIRGSPVLINDEGLKLQNINVRSFCQGDVLGVFMDSDQNGKAYHWYGLFNNKLLDKIDLHKYSYNIYACDIALICYFVEFGNLRVVSGTNQYYRVHKASFSSKISLGWFNFAKLSYHFLPISYYAYNFRIVSLRYKFLLLLFMPIKFIYTQIFLFNKVCRRFLKKFLNSK
jgi:glycosyltransferase involved in cell wall biosynthesis